MTAYYFACPFAESVVEGFCTGDGEYLSVPQATEAGWFFLAFDSGGVLTSFIPASTLGDYNLAVCDFTGEWMQPGSCPGSSILPVTLSAPSSSTGSVVFPEVFQMTAVQGSEIGVAILAVLAVAWVFRVLIRALSPDENSSG